MAQCLPSAEYRAVVSCTYELIIGIAVDWQSVARKLFAKQLITSLPADSGKDDKTAQEIVEKVTDQVKLFPQNFKKFVAALEEILQFKNLAKMLTDELEKIKTKSSEEAVQIESKSASPEPYSSDYSDDEATDHFPYLNSEDMSEEKRERLKAKLEIQSEEMEDEFATLVDRARESLEEQNITCNDLAVLVRHSRKSRLKRVVTKQKSIRDLFLKLANYWTFFDYEFLKLIIGRHCPELDSELSSYESSLKEYCERRLCELPSDVFAKRNNNIHNLYVKMNRDFTTTLTDVKKLEYRLSHLLETEIYLLRVEDGCIELVFNSLCDISTPLTPEQTKPLKELRVMRVYDDKTEYFNNLDAHSSTLQAEKTDRFELEDDILPWNNNKKGLPSTRKRLQVQKRKFLQPVCRDKDAVVQRKSRVCTRKRKHLPYTSDDEDGSLAEKRPEKGSIPFHSLHEEVNS